MTDRVTVDLYPFANRSIFPLIADLEPEQRAALPDDVTHIEWVEAQCFGKVVWRLHIWRLGITTPFVWRKLEEKYR